jgi:hypothetical protein
VAAAAPTRHSGFVFDLAAFCADVRLCFTNCMLYCPTAEPLHGTARALLDKFDADIQACPPPVPVLPEPKRDRPRPAGSRPADSAAAATAAAAAAADASCAVTDTTTSALSAGSNGGGRGGSGPPAKKKQRRSSAAAAEAAGGGPGAAAGARAAAAAGAPPRNARQLKRRLEYLRQARVRLVSRENGVNDVPMTHEEKTRLTNRLQHIGMDKVTQLVRILSRAGGRSAVPDKDDEIEIDLDKLPPATAREIEVFVDGCVARHVGGEPIKAGRGGIGDEFESIAEVEVEMAAATAELQQLKARRAAAASSGGLWDNSSSSGESGSGDSSDDDSSSGSESDSSADNGGQD